MLEINMIYETTFKINDAVLDKVNDIKYIGFIIDQEIKFKAIKKRYDERFRKID